MKKSLFSMMVAAGLIASGAALADSANVTIYGTINAAFEPAAKRDGATVGTGVALNSLVAAPSATPVNSSSRNRFSQNSSNIGFRGVEDMGAGLKAVWQIESSLSPDGGGTTLGSRNTYIGLTSKFGTLLYAGSHDTPYKDGVQGKDPFYVTGVATQKGILGSPGFNTISVGTNAAGLTMGDGVPNFDARMNNQIIYRTPVFYGFKADVGYGANESNQLTTTTLNPYVWSLKVLYERGPLWVTYSYERRKDLRGLNGFATTGGAGNGPAAVATANDSTDTGNKVGIAYNFGPYALGTTELLFVWERLAYERSGPGIDGVAVVSEYDRNAYVFSVNHRIGSHRFPLSFGIAKAGSCKLGNAAACTTTGLGAKQISFGYAYTLSKRTDLYAFYTKIINDSAASYFLGVAGAAATLPGGPGSDPRAFALGIRHVF